MMKQKFLLFPVLLMSLCLGACNLRGEHHAVTDYMTSLKYKDGFRIVQFSDLHLSSQRNLDEDYTFLTGLVKRAKEAKPVDLIVFTGDLFTFASKLTIQHTFEIFDSWDIPWTLTFGNHDEQLFGEFTYTAEEASSGKYKNCIFKYVHDDMTGLTNSIVNLVDDNNHVKYQIFCVDSNTYNYQKGTGYDYVHEDQQKWYEEGLEWANKKEYGSSWKKGDEAIPSMIFQHIPLYEITTAIKDYAADPSIGTGVNKESGSPSDYNSQFLKLLNEYGSTEAVVVGHDHVNDSEISYDKLGNVSFVYGVKSTNNIYHDEDMLGFRDIEVYNDAHFETETHMFKYGEVK